MGIYDRDYIRERPTPTGPAGTGGGVPGAGGGHPVTWALIIGMGMLFLFYAVIPPEGKRGMLAHFSLSHAGIFEHLYLHTLLTAGLLHAHFGHLLVNLLLLFFLGKTLEEEPVVGSRNLVWLFVLGVLGGSALFLAIPVEARALGASGGVLALAIVAALALPHRTVSLFGLVNMPMTFFVVLVVVLTLLPIGMATQGAGIAHFAHLGGLATGFVYYIFDLRLFAADGRFRLLRKRTGGQRGASTSTSAPPSGADPEAKARMEKLLQKISEDGIESLTDEERDFLNRASRKYR